MRLTLFLFLAIFITSTVTAQLYDNRSRYLKTPYDVDRYERNLNTFQKPTRRAYTRSTQSYNSRRSYSSYRNPQYYRTNSYNNYRSRVSRYTIPSYDSRGFYERFREPNAYKRYNGYANYYSGRTEFDRPKINFQCFCFVPIDINSILNFYTSIDGEIKANRQRIINGQEEEYSKELSNRGFPKNYGETFKDQQKRFFKAYVQKFNSGYEGGKRTSYNEHKERLVGELKNTAERFDAIFEGQIATTVVFDFLKRYKSNPRNTASPKKYVGDLKIGQRYVHDIPSSNYDYFNLVKSLLRAGNRSAVEQLSMRNLYYNLQNLNNLNDYLTDRYIRQYDNEYNLYKRFAFQSTYLIDYLRGHQLTDHNINRINDKYDFSGYLNFIPYNRTAIINFYKGKLSANSGYSMSFEKAKAVMAIYNSFPKNISDYILNNAYLKSSVINYLENATPTYEELITIEEVIDSRINNKPFKWPNQLEYLKEWDYQQPSSPETIMKIHLKASLPQWWRLLDYGVEKSFDIDFGMMTYEFYMHNGIGNVLRNIYRNPSSWSVEGGTIRHFLNTKGFRVPHSLSNRDLGKLFDFGGGNSNTLTIQFSDYAKKFITNFHHGDGKYGTSLFTDPFKLQALKEILDGNTVDFQNEIIIDSTFKSTKEYCVLKELISTQNNLLKRVSNQFTQNKSKFKLRFTTYNNSGDIAHFRTGPDKQNSSMINIRLNLSQKGGTAIDLASSILHEAIHAELHRIYLSDNKPPYNYPKDQYDWLMDMYEFYQNDKNPANNAHHFFMASLHIDPLTKALRDYDKQKHPLENYKYLAWDGLYEFGKAIGLINRKEFDRLERLLSQTVYSDSYESNCN